MRRALGHDFGGEEIQAAVERHPVVIVCGETGSGKTTLLRVIADLERPTAGTIHVNGKTPEEAFYVKCDEETNPPEVIDAGQVITEIGICPVKPAEFVIFRIGQWTADRLRRRRGVSGLLELVA